MASIFTKIINREIPGQIVAETDDYIAFLDIRPMTQGHTLCVPKREVDYYFDLTEEQITGLAVFSRKVAIALKKVVSCKRIATAVLGLEVPHAHLHLIPIEREQDFNFAKSVNVSAERMAELRERIEAAFTNLGGGTAR